MTREPVSAPAPANTIPFPLNIRALQAGWKLLFFRAGASSPIPAKSAEWNRGAYLARRLSHCGACHTPRNLLGAEKAGDGYAGALVDNWIAPAADSRNPRPCRGRKTSCSPICATASALSMGSRPARCRRSSHDRSRGLPDRTSGRIGDLFRRRRSTLAHAQRR